MKIEIVTSVEPAHEFMDKVNAAIKKIEDAGLTVRGVDVFPIVWGENEFNDGFGLYAVIKYDEK